jgi:hypothetical protein
MDRWIEYSGMTEPATYCAIAEGKIRAKKLGRTLLIDVASGDEHLDSLPDAKSRRAVAASSSAPVSTEAPRFETPPAVP